jgi:hypothetical protein
MSGTLPAMESPKSANIAGRGTIVRCVGALHETLISYHGQYELLCVVLIHPCKKLPKSALSVQVAKIVIAFDRGAAFNVQRRNA